VNVRAYLNNFIQLKEDLIIKYFIYWLLRITILFAIITPNLLYAQVDSFKVVKSITPIVSEFKSTTLKHPIDQNLNIESSSDLIISFSGASKGFIDLLHNTYPDDVWQRMEWEFLEINFRVEANFINQENDLLSFKVVKKEGIVIFKGTATQHNFGNTYVYNFDRTQKIELENQEGLLQYSISKDEMTYLDFSIHASIQ
jgi:hypothetical protein